MHPDDASPHTDYSFSQLVDSSIESFTDVDEKTEVSESKFKTGVEEKVQNDNVELESFTDVDVDEKTEPEVTESK